MSSLYQFAIIIITNILVSGGIGYLLYRFGGMAKIWCSFFLLLELFPVYTPELIIY